jgi:hypothetical protein
MGRKESLMKMSIIAVVFLFLTVAASGAQRNALPLVEDGQSRAVIVVPDDASPGILETAQDLSEIIGRMSGARLPVVSEANGKPALKLAVQDQDRSLPPLAYHVLREDSVLYISGGSDQGVINGVYAFLEQELGCRWYTPDSLGEYIPRRTTIRVGDLRMQDAPDFDRFSGFGRHANEEASRLWMRRNRLAGFRPQFHSHNWHNIIPADSIENHPEWFALLGTGRSTDELCTTHPEVLEIFIKQARRYLDENPDAQSFSLSPNDNTAFCRCDNCLALDAKLGVAPFVPGGSMTDRLVYFFNKVATEVVKTHPDKRLSFYAYLTYTKPPEVVKPHPMLQPFLVHTPWEYCMHHPIDDADCERNRPFAKNLLGWSELCSELGMYDYYAHWSLGGPMGMLRRIQRDLSWFRSHNGVEFYSEAHPRFGPAAQPVSVYGQMFEDVMTNVPKDAQHDFEQAFLISMTPEFLARATALLDEGEELVKNADLPTDEAAAIMQRLRRYRYGLRIAEHQAGEKQARLAGRWLKVNNHLNALMAILDEISADPVLADAMTFYHVRRFSQHELNRLPKYDQIWEQAVPSSERRAELQRKLDQGHNRKVARALGYWNDWHLVGLWTNPGGMGIDTHFPPEDKIDLDATYQVRGGKAGWRFHQSNSAYGTVDLREHFLPEDSEYTTAYAYTTVKMEHDADVFLDVRCDDDIVLWVNDQLVFADGASKHGWNLHLNVHLNEGVNTIFSKILNKWHGFNFSLRIVSEDGQAHPAVVWDQLER